MGPSKFTCSASYQCVCAPGRPVSLRTARNHRKAAQRERRRNGNLNSLPHPLPYSEEAVQDIAVQEDAGVDEDFQAHVDISDRSPASERINTRRSILTSPSPENPDTENEVVSTTPIGLIEKGNQGNQDSSSFTGPPHDHPVIFEDNDIEFPGTLSEGPDDTLEEGASKSNSESSSASDLSGFMMQSLPELRLRQFVQNTPWVLGFGIKHNCTVAQMEDLLIREKALYKSWGGLRKAIIRSSGLNCLMFPFCSSNHEALEKNSDGNLNNCSHKLCRKQGVKKETREYEYLSLWERLEGRLKSNSQGPELYSYYQEGIKRANGQVNNDEDTEEIIYEDFFSGALFQKAQQSLGGIDNIRYDIFLFLTTDGVDPFKSTSYSYWPVVLFIGNLPPWERFKMHNILPVMIIPGPKSPVNITSFLKPVLDEIKELSSTWLEVLMWDGCVRRVRVHLLFAMGDLPAMAKLCHLRGHNALFPCRYCHIRGIRKDNHCYYPHRVVLDIKNENGSVRKRKVVNSWDIRHLPIRQEKDLYESYSSIGAAQDMGNTAQAEELAKSQGLSGFKDCPLNGRMSPLLEMDTIVPFRSFPIDTMHLLFLNVPKQMLSLWMVMDPEAKHVAFLSDKKVFDAVNERIQNAGSGM